MKHARLHSFSGSPRLTVFLVDRSLPACSTSCWCSDCEVQQMQGLWIRDYLLFCGAFLWWHTKPYTHTDEIFITTCTCKVHIWDAAKNKDMEQIRFQEISFYLLGCEDHLYVTADWYETSQFRFIYILERNRCFIANKEGRKELCWIENGTKHKWMQIIGLATEASRHIDWIWCLDVCILT